MKLERMSRGRGREKGNLSNGPCAQNLCSANDDDDDHRRKKDIKCVNSKTKVK